MDISKLKPVRISPLAREKVIYDFFPDFEFEEEVFDGFDEVDDIEMHAGALCLYAATLITQVHEKDPLALDPYYKERESSYKALIKANPKYASFTDEQISTFAKNLIIKDIRNSFAHGNFEISYSAYTKKLNFVLYPQRKDFITPEPIVVTKNALIKANASLLNDIGTKYMGYNDYFLRGEVNNHLHRAIKGFILPTQMLQLSKYYLDNSIKYKTDIMFEEKMYHFIQYALLASKITYDQNDYYNLFGKTSNIFEAISLVRNSLAHDNIEFTDNAKNILYTDGSKTLSESIGKSASKLLVVDSQKQSLLKLKEDRSELSIDSLVEKFKEIYDFFFDGTNDFEEIVNTIIDDDNEEKV